MNAADYLRNIFSPGNSQSEPAEINKIIYFKLIAYSSVIFSLITAIRFFISDNTIIPYVFSGFGFLVLLNIFLLKGNSGKANSHVLLVLISGLDYFIFCMPEILYGWVFILFFPVVSIWLTGPKTGIIYSAALALILIIEQFVHVISMASYDTGFNLVFFSAYFLACALIYFLFDSGNKRLSAEVELNRSLNEDLKKKNDFITGLSHQLRTSLSNIMLVNNMIYDSKLDQKQKDLIITLIASTNNLVEAVNKIGNISTPDFFHQKERLVSFNLANALLSIKKLFSEREDVVFDLQISNNIQNNLLGDPVIIKQILLNLMQNIMLPVPIDLVQKISLNVMSGLETKSEMRVTFIIETYYQKAGVKFSGENSRISISNLSSVDFSNTVKLIEFAGGTLNAESKAE